MSDKPAESLSVLEQSEARARAIADKLFADFELTERAEFRGQFELTVPLARLLSVASKLKEDADLKFVQLTDVTAVDYLKLDGNWPERFAILYTLFSFENNCLLRLRVWVSEEDPLVPTLSELYPAADWGEREVYDMFGIEFGGHPNLQRILMPLDFGSYPLRKDYPLRGRGERDDFPRLRRGGKDDL